MSDESYGVFTSPRGGRSGGDDDDDDAHHHQYANHGRENRSQRRISVGNATTLTARATEELAFRMDTRTTMAATTAATARGASVAPDSILAFESLRASRPDELGGDASAPAPPLLRPSDDAPTALTTQYFTRLAGNLLGHYPPPSTASSADSILTTTTTPLELDDAPIRLDSSLRPTTSADVLDPRGPHSMAVEFDKISVDSGPFAIMAPPTRALPTSTSSFEPVTMAPMTSSSSPPRPLRRRLSSDLVSSISTSTQHELDSSTNFTASGYQRMRGTLDPVAMLDAEGGDRLGVHGSLRPVVNPFASRERPMNLSDAPTAQLPTNRSQRSGTVLVPGPDPRGTFRTTTAETTRQIFAAQHVRLQDRWLTDIWIYMKNTHPYLRIVTAHHWHPFKKSDRVLVLLTSFVVAFLVCGLYAIQDCCRTKLETPVAVISNSHRRQLTEIPVVATPRCLSFGSSCNDDPMKELCTQGSTCLAGSSGRRTCAAVVNATSCDSTGHCPLGWICDAKTRHCRPSSTLICYLLPPTGSSQAVAFAAETDTPIPQPIGEVVTSAPSNGSGSQGGTAPVDAISAIANLIQYAKDNNVTTSGSGSTDTPTQTPLSTPPINATLPPQSSAPSSSSSSAGSSIVPTEIELPSKTKKPRVQTLKVSLTEPRNGGVYGISTSIPIRWEVVVIEGERSLVDSLRFHVDFSRDGSTFSTITSGIASELQNGSTTKYHYDWDLNKNTSLTCTSCVLRVCTENDGSSDVDPICLRSDGATEGRSTSLLASTSGSASKITFHIVREILECSCGIKYASFVTYSYLIALVIPFAALFLEQFVTFYQDSKAFGMLRRRGSPGNPGAGSYAEEATRRGRVFLGFILVCLIFGSGLALGQISKARFFTETGKVVILWLVTFALVIMIGFVYCSVVYGLIFAVRWHRDIAIADPRPIQPPMPGPSAMDIVIVDRAIASTTRQAPVRPPPNVGGEWM